MKCCTVLNLRIYYLSNNPFISLTLSDASQKYQLPDQRRRKRDVLKRTLGLGGSTSGIAANSDSDGGETSEPIKLNTDGLFQGMPGINSILGSSASSEEPLATSSSNTNKDEVTFQKAGTIPSLPNFLSPEDESNLDSTYEQFKEKSSEMVLNEYKKGEFGEAVTEEEAKRIVEYAMEEEVRSVLYALFVHQ